MKDPTSPAGAGFLAESALPPGERQETEAFLRQHGRHLRTVTSNAPLVLWAVDREGVFTLSEGQALESLGLQPGQVVGQSVFELYKDHPEVVRDLRRALGGDTFTGVHTIGTLHFETRFAPLRDAAGRIQGVTGISFDITERRRAEEALRLSEEKFARVFRSSPDAVLITRLADGRIREVNDGFVRMTGYQPAEVLGLTTLELGFWAEPAQRAEYIERLRAQRHVYSEEYRFRIRSGDVRTGLLSAEVIVVEREPCVLSVIRDITDRKRDEEALAEARALLLATIEQIPAGLIIADPPDLRIRVANSAALGLHGGSGQALADAEIPPELHPRNWQVFWPDGTPVVPEDLPLARAVQRGETSRNVEVRIRRPNGQDRWVLANAAPVRNAQGQVAAGVVVFLDITEQRLSEEALRQSRADLERAQAVGRIGSWVSDPGTTGRLLWSAETCRIFGIREAEFDHRVETFFQRVHPEDLASLQTAVRAALAGHQSFDIEHRIVRPDGAVRWVREQAEVERDEGGAPVRMVGVVQDITDRRLLEEQLRQSQKMESIGQLAAGVAHDFNNILTIINLGASMLLRDVGQRPPAKATAQQVLSAVERASNLTRQLLLFSRKQHMQPRAVNLNELASNLTRMLSRTLGEDITLEFSYSPDLPMVNADPGMLEQTILNLAVNARDAMPRGGRLQLSTAAVEITPAQTLLNPDARPGTFVRLAVSDTGCGIAPEIRDRIFEPFFTTKEVGKGTGLGLATVYGIVKQHGGWVEFTSAVGQGTTFQIFLPAGQPTAEPEGDDAPHREVDGHGETILVVEDETDVRELVSAVLRRHGYKVLLAGSGTEAQRLPREQLERVDLLLTDVVMPGGLSGRELADLLQIAHPRLKVIYCSGYSRSFTGAAQELVEGTNYLQKPLTPQQVLEAIRGCLDGNG